MKGRPFDLVDLQHWMQAAITHPAGVSSTSAVGEVIAPSRALASEDRLAIYGHAYFLRLLDCLRELFPALAQLLGDDTFGEFGLAYLTRYPPRSYTLTRLADRFVDFLRETRPSGEDAWTDLVIDLATLEHAIDEVFDGPGEEESPANLAEKLGAISQDQWPNLSLRVSASLRLLSFSFPLDDLYTALRRGDDDPPLPSREPAHLAIWRRDYVVRRLPLTEAARELLQRLANAEPLAAAIAAASSWEGEAPAEPMGAEARARQTARREPRPPEALDPAMLSAWFEQWTAAGILADIAP